MACGGGSVTEIRLGDALPIIVVGVVVAGYQAFSEEVVFRGGVFTLLPASISTGWAITVSTALFVLFHAPRWEALISGPYVVQLVLAGVAFAFAYVRTGSLWLGIGLHGGWNLGAYLFREGTPTLLTLAGDLPGGWGGWSSWASVAGNGVLLLLALWLSSPRQHLGRGVTSRVQSRP